MSTSRGGSDSSSTRWCGHGSTSRRRRSGKSRIWASARAMFGTSCRPISTSTTREGSAISPTLRSTFSPTSFGQPRIGRRLASETGTARQIAAVKKWAAVEEGGESWFGFSAVRGIPGTRDEVLLVPLPGHSRGHCGVAVRRANDWLLHCGDAYFHHSEVEPHFGAAPKGVRWFESLVEFDGAQRRANQGRLRELARLAAGKVKLICSHDPAEFAAMRSAAREERAGQQSVSTRRRPSQRDVRAAE